tara:strand:- start:675 stop:1457 length:783 start_codon:yes stop_codon:yes gene_type:complete
MNRRRPNLPGPIVNRHGSSAIMGNKVRMPGQWWQPKLSNVETSVTTRLDAGAGGASQDALGVWTVHVQGGTACNKPGEGVLYGWDLTPALGFDGWVCGDINTLWTALEITDNSGLGNSNLVITCGVCGNAAGLPDSSFALSGLHYDGSNEDNPEVRVGIGRDGTGSDSGAQAGVVGVLGVIQVLPGQILSSCHANAMTNTTAAGLTWKYTKRATSTSQSLTNSSPAFFLALGRSGSTAGTESISFKLHVAFSGRQPTWFP